VKGGGEKKDRQSFRLAVSANPEEALVSYELALRSAALNEREKKRRGKEKKGKRCRRKERKREKVTRARRSEVKSIVKSGDYSRLPLSAVLTLMENWMNARKGREGGRKGKEAEGEKKRGGEETIRVSQTFVVYVESVGGRGRERGEKNRLKGRERGKGEKNIAEGLLNS